MDILIMDARTFVKLQERIAALSERVNYLYRYKNKDGLGSWLDGQEVCQLLNISKRTLQSYRDNGTIPYTQINRKMYYSRKDIETLLNNLKSK